MATKGQALNGDGLWTRRARGRGAATACPVGGPVRVLLVVAVTAGMLMAPAAPSPDRGPGERVTGSLTTDRLLMPAGLLTTAGDGGWRTMPSRPAGNAVMVGGTPPSGVRVQVRARRAARWSPWRSLAPGIPVWLGRVDGLQVRVRRPADGAGAADAGSSGIRLSLVEIHPSGAGDPLDLLPPLPALPRLEPGGPTPRDTGPTTPRPGIHGRDAWGPRRAVPDHRPPPPTYASGVRHVVVHHTATVWGSTPCSEADDLIRAMYRYHVELNGWDDIGYNLLVDPCGRIWEGRAGGVGRAVVGAHAGGWNHGSTGIALMGRYDGPDRVPREAVDALDRLVAWKTDLHGIDPRGTTTETSRGGSSRVPEGRRATFPTIHGHRRTNHTTCPGEDLNHWVVGGHGRRSMGARVAAIRRRHDRRARRSARGQEDGGTLGQLPLPSGVVPMVEGSMAGGSPERGALLGSSPGFRGRFPDG